MCLRFKHNSELCAACCFGAPTVETTTGSHGNRVACCACLRFKHNSELCVACCFGAPTVETTTGSHDKRPAGIKSTKKAVEVRSSLAKSGYELAKAAQLVVDAPEATEPILSKDSSKTLQQQTRFLPCDVFRSAELALNYLGRSVQHRNHLFVGRRPRQPDDHDSASPTTRHSRTVT
ncbi:hypothetical protein pipiens_013603 [Culex pipiens pipiens]|uniref:Uncharacterized protein n=1 Tax=Culex pipiens pipiens TaxID=38569 RepID=A0ABD1D0B2_CULPP